MEIIVTCHGGSRTPESTNGRTTSRTSCTESTRSKSTAPHNWGSPLSAPSPGTLIETGNIKKNLGDFLNNEENFVQKKNESVS